MKYHCTDCTYSGRTSGRAGECPACGSHALVRRKQRVAENPRSRWRIGLLVALWAYLIIHVFWKLNT